MSPEKQRIAIAKYCGFQFGRALDGTVVVYQNDKGTSLIPNYLGDLNAIHEVEKTLLDTQIGEYTDHLIDLADVLYFQATAAQRSEAFLKTIGKWD